MAARNKQGGLASTMEEGGAGERGVLVSAPQQQLGEALEVPPRKQDWRAANMDSMGRFHFSGNRGFAWLRAPIPGGNTSCNPLGVDNEEQGAFGAGVARDDTADR